MTEKENMFTWEDYAVFGALLTVSTGIGAYHGLKQSSGTGQAAQFLTAQGKMPTIPVALSLLASFLSSVTLMGHPAEVYLYGTQIWWFGPTTFLVVPLVGCIMVPFFKKNNFVSAYQYFGVRFNRKLQLCTSILFSFQVVFFLALVVYAPAMALNQAAGIDPMVVVTVLYIICIFYTTLGGMQAVVWTDAIQVVVIFGSLVAIVIRGTASIGGVSVVWERNKAFARTTFFNWNTDATERFTLWSTCIGSTIGHITLYGGNQLQVQRYFTVPTVKEVQKMLWLNAIGWTAMITITTYTGMLIFATYLGCDPLLTRRIHKADQLFPLYVADVLSDYPGFRGLFISSLFSAALSTMSTGLNSLSAVWYSELNSTKFKKRLSDAGAGRLVKCLALLFGLISYSCVFIVPFMGGLIVMNMTFLSICIGSLFGLFIMGMVFTKANTLGASVGLAGSVALMLWVSLGGMAATKEGYQVEQSPLPTSISHCSATFNSTNQLISHYWSEERPKAFVLYRISYLWYNPLAMTSCVIIGVVVSYIYHALVPSKMTKVTLPLEEAEVNVKIVSDK